MTDADKIGTALERRGRRQYWAILGGALVLALAIGIAGRSPGGWHGTIDPVLAIILAFALSLLLTVGTWLYFRKVDELEWANNLFACFWGFNAFVLGFPVWLILRKGRLVPEPDMFVIYLGAILVGFAAYLWKRFR